VKANISRVDGQALTAEERAGWSIEDPKGFLTTKANVTVNASGVASGTMIRVDVGSLDSLETTLKLKREGATYATAPISVVPYIIMTTDSVDKLTTDGAETITGLSINGTAVELDDYIITSTDADIANGTITPRQAGPATFTVAKKTDPTKTGTGSITFHEPVAQVGDSYYKTLTKAFAGAPSGSTITLLNDTVETVDFGGTQPRVQDFTLTFDLNGHTLTAKNGSVFALRVDYGEITVKDSVGGGAINGNGTYYAFLVSHLAGDYPSKLIIESGNFQGKTSVAQVGASGGTASNKKYYGGDLVIKGGTFVAVPDEGETYDADGNFKYALNMLDMNASQYPGGIYSPSTITVTGGKFYKFNPANNAAEGANTNFVADGWKSVKTDDWYEVEPAE